MFSTNFKLQPWEWMCVRSYARLNNMGGVAVPHIKHRFWQFWCWKVLAWFPKQKTLFWLFHETELGLRVGVWVHPQPLLALFSLYVIRHCPILATFGKTSQLAEPLWTDPGLKNGISVYKPISTLKKTTKNHGQGMNCRTFSPILACEENTTTTKSQHNWIGRWTDTKVTVLSSDLGVKQSFLWSGKSGTECIFSA